MLSTKSDKIIINLNINPINNIESSLDVLQKFIIEQVKYLFIQFELLLN